MKTCNNNCVPTCDFCKSYHDNGGEIRIPDSFEGEGTCDIDQKHVEATDGRKCENFDCFNSN